MVWYDEATKKRQSLLLEATGFAFSNFEVSLPTTTNEHGWVQKKKAKSDAGENIKLCHLVLPTYRIKKRQSLLLRANFACGKFSDTQTRNIRTSPGGPCKGWGTTSLLTKQKRQSRQLSTKREATLPFQPKRLDDLSSWQDKSSSQKGWVSIDRSMVAALPSTTPRPAHKSSTDDLGPPLCQVNEEESYSVLSTEKQSSPDRDGVRRLSFPEQGRRPNGIVAMTRRDSALEAFRHNPTDGSFAPPTDRSSTCTKCPNLRFLSYWAGLLSQRRVNSRVKLTCLTTV